MKTLVPFALAATLAVAAGIAIAQTTLGGGHAGHGNHATANDAGAQTPSTAAFRDANARMHEEMAIEFTDDADIDFLRGMIPHHQGAIDMARIVLDHGSDPQVRALAEEIVAAQEAEIELMQTWLAERDR